MPGLRSPNTANHRQECRLNLAGASAPETGLALRYFRFPEAVCANQSRLGYIALLD